MRLLVCGDRNWDDYVAVRRVVYGLADEAHQNEWHATSHHEVGVTCTCLTVIHGTARGADRMAGEAALYRRVLCEEYEPDWETHGRAAGVIRNQRMLAEGKPDLVYAFHDDLANSRGTKDMVQRAAKADIPVYVVSRWVIPSLFEHLRAGESVA